MRLQVQVAVLLCFVGNVSAFLVSAFLPGSAAGFKSGLAFVRIDPRKAYDRRLVDWFIFSLTHAYILYTRLLDLKPLEICSSTKCTKMSGRYGGAVAQVFERDRQIQRQELHRRWEWVGLCQKERWGVGGPFTIIPMGMIVKGTTRKHWTHTHTHSLENAVLGDYDQTSRLLPKWIFSILPMLSTPSHLAP